MARFHGIIGYSELEETSPGIWSEKIVERTYTGDMTKNFVNADSSPRINTNVKLSNTISIYSDPYANSNLFNIRYLKYLGGKWKVESVEIAWPRLILTLGDVYND
jgi:hypothetical protein